MTALSIKALYLRRSREARRSSRAPALRRRYFNASFPVCLSETRLKQQTGLCFTAQRIAMPSDIFALENPANATAI
ncbi:hypothetical protein E2C01_015114 [Portunus trituberculatus]|uniref:Uncharacterized protein n=1 Tax=Portunus trituberculatus TaxID=210409 RepID=A0A5B7DKY6_PORTR|nr:hypothetical protein [Portunus trituberculatus]